MVSRRLNGLDQDIEVEWITRTWLLLVALLGGRCISMCEVCVTFCDDWQVDILVF